VVDSRLDIETVQALVNDFARQRGPLRVLDAGCGSQCRITVPQGSFVVGVDSSRTQVERNPSLDEAMIGDLETVAIPDEAFNLVFCWQVLEHLPNPMSALDRLVRASTSGGLIILGVPNVMSWKGLLTKFTPHRFHVWVYRRAFRKPDAGIGDRAPFPTFLRFAIRPSALQRYAESRELTVERAWFSESSFQRALRSRFRFGGWVWRILVELTKVVSLGKVSAEATEFTMVLRKPLKA
jgi:SAM-dependent methyltransferase